MRTRCYDTLLVNSSHECTVELSSALQLAGCYCQRKQLVLTMKRLEWQTGKKSLSSSCCHSQKVFIHLRMGVSPRLFMCSLWSPQHEDCNLEKNKDLCKAGITQESFRSVCTLILSNLFNCDTCKMTHRDNMQCCLPLPSVLANSLACMRTKIPYSTELLQPLPPLSTTNISLTWNQYLQVCRGPILLIARKHTYESRCGNWNAKWHTCTFTNLPLCMYKKLRRLLSKDIVGTTPMHEHLYSFALLTSFCTLHAVFMHCACKM